MSAVPTNESHQTEDPAAGITAFTPSLRMVTIGMLTLVTMIAFEALAVATALPVVVQALHAVGAYGLAISAFMATQLFGTVVSGFVSDKTGPAVPLLGGLGGFVVGLVASGVAPGITMFVAGRALAGFGSGLVAVAIYVLIGRAYPDALRPRVFGWFSTAWVVPSLVGPALAGWLAQAVTWRVIFLGVPPIAIAAAIALWPTLRRLHGRSGDEAQQLHPGRRMLAGVGIAVAATALQWGAQRLHGAVGIAAMVVGGCLLVAMLAVLLPAGTARLARGLPALIASRGMLTTCFFGADALLPLVLVTGHGLSPAVAGLALTCGAIGWSGGAWVQARVRGNAMHTRLFALGAAGVAIGCASLGVVELGLPTWAVAPAWVFSGACMGAAMSSGSVLLLNLSARSEQGRNSSYLQLADSLGGVLGVGVAGAIFAAAHARGQVEPAVFTAIWVILAVIGLCAGLAARRTRT